MSKFKAEVTLVYQMECDDEELELVGCTLAELTPHDLQCAREEMVESTFQVRGECISAETEIMVLESLSQEDG